MYSYEEFPIQIESEIVEFAKKNNFFLVEKREDHYLRYKNKEWEIVFLCSEGEVIVSLVCLEDGFRYELFSILRLWFPESCHTQRISQFIWGNLSTIKFIIEVLNNYYPLIVNDYSSRKNSLESVRLWSERLINFVEQHGSRNLKKNFTWSTNDKIEQASTEYVLKISKTKLNSNGISPKAERKWWRKLFGSK